MCTSVAVWVGSSVRQFLNNPNESLRHYAPGTRRLPTHLATCCSGSRLMSTYTANVIIMTSDHRPIEMESDHYLIKDLGHLKYVDKKITIIRYDSLAYAVRRRVSALQGLRDRLGQSSHVARPGPVPLVQVGQDAGR